MTIKNLSVSYQGDGRVIENLNFEINKSEVLCIVGESGSGKSTLINVLMNILPRSGQIENGNIHFEDDIIDFKDVEKWREMRGKNLSMIFQNPASYFNPVIKIKNQFIRTIRAHTDLTKEQALKKSVEILEKMGFESPERILSSYMYQLSGGMAQRVAIAIAIAMVLEPKIIFADEPTSALDVANQMQVMDELLKLRNTFGTTIVVVTHNMGCASYMSDRIMIMNKGRIEESGSREKVLYAPETTYAKTLMGSVPKLRGDVI